MNKPARKKQTIEDAALIRAREILSGRASSPADLAAEYASLTASYSSLLRKLHKTLVISDSYQVQLLTLNSTLSQRIEEETERRLAHERLLAQNSKLAAMGEMIDAIAHQWRQPLSTVSMIVQTLREAYLRGKLDDAYLERAIGSALSQLQYMTETISTFRGFFRHEKEPEPFSASAKVASAIELLRSQLKGNGITLDFTATPGDDTIHGFANEFVQVIVNLLANSCEAIQERQSLETTSTEYQFRQDKICISVICEGKQVIIEVGDTGSGIPPESADRLFDSDFSTKKSREGTGMGLYMSRLIIEQSMAGKIFFKSVAGMTVFRLELPRGSTAPAVASE